MAFISSFAPGPAYSSTLQSNFYIPKLLCFQQRTMNFLWENLASTSELAVLASINDDFCFFKTRHACGEFKSIQSFFYLFGNINMFGWSSLLKACLDVKKHARNMKLCCMCIFEEGAFHSPELVFLLFSLLKKWHDGAFSSSLRRCLLLDLPQPVCWNQVSGCLKSTQKEKMAVKRKVESLN